MSFKRIIALVLSLLMVMCLIPSLIPSADNIELTIMFTHDIHDYLYPTTTINGGKSMEHGGIAKLATIIKENAGPNTIYLDGGDWSMGTLYQSIFTSDAVELRNLGLIGCDVTTFGNHDFDYGSKQVAEMLRNAKSSGDPLPQLVQSNIDFSGELTPEQSDLKKAFDELNVKEYTILNVGGYKVGVFGLLGPDSIDCTQADLSYVDYIEAAKKTVNKLKSENCDLIVALSHSGTISETKGEDIDLARAVPDINVIISAHSHSLYKKPVYVGDTLIACCGEYLNYVGKVSFTMENGKMNVTNYEVIPIDSSVHDDPQTAQVLENYKSIVNQNYLAPYGVTFDQVLAYSKYNFIGLDEMYQTHKEFNLGNLIADSYIYQAEKCGINDIDVALVALGTIRASIKRGNISVADAFEVCSLGIGEDGSAGHPIIVGYITGKELKLLGELDASLGPDMNSIKMSYNGLEMTFNTKRIILDRVTDIHLVKNKKSIPIEDDKLYKVAANLYAVNMLGMVNDLTKGLLTIEPKNIKGEVIENLYTASMRDQDGKEVKEWVAFKNYISSFPDNKTGGLPTLPDDYSTNMGRKKVISVGGSAIFTNPGTATPIVPIFIAICIVAFVFIIAFIILIIIIVRTTKKNKMLDYINDKKEKKRKEKEKSERQKRLHRELYKPEEDNTETEDTVSDSDDTVSTDDNPQQSEESSDKGNTDQTEQEQNPVQE